METISAIEYSILIAENVFNWHYKESEDCFIEHKTGRMCYNFNPLENTEDAFLAIEHFDEYVITKNRKKDEYEVRLVHEGVELSVKAKDRNTAICQVIQKYINSKKGIS